MFIEEKRYDAGMLRIANLPNQLQWHSSSPTGEPYCIYRDPVYPVRLHLQFPCRHGQLTKEAFNTSWKFSKSNCGIGFWWHCHLLCISWLQKQLKDWTKACGEKYCVCVLLRNAFTWLYDHQHHHFLNYSLLAFMIIFKHVNQSLVFNGNLIITFNRVDVIDLSGGWCYLPFNKQARPGLQMSHHCCTVVTSFCDFHWARVAILTVTWISRLTSSLWGNEYDMCKYIYFQYSFVTWSFSVNYLSCSQY